MYCESILLLPQMILERKFAQKQGAIVGLGCLPKDDSLSCRRRPLLELPSGEIVPVSLDLLVERAVDLYYADVGKKLYGNARRAMQPVGLYFEAHVHNLASRLTERHLVFDSRQLEGILKAQDEGHQICDHLIVDRMTGGYLFVETSVQRTPQGVARADPQDYNRLLEQYQQEADQVVSCAEQVETIRRAINGPPVRSRAVLVVTSLPLRATPVLGPSLRKLRSSRTPSFVCSVEEFAELVDLGQAGWDLARLVATWQNGPADMPFWWVLGKVRAASPGMRANDDDAAREFTGHIPLKRIQRAA